MFVTFMRMRRRLLFASLVVAIAACGSRTGLLVPLDFEEADGAIVHPAYGPEDALPPIAVGVPEDVTVLSGCPDASSTLIYLISQANNLYSFYPPAAELTLVGTIACPSNSMPFSMAVDRTGLAYVIFQDGHLFRVSTA